MNEKFANYFGVPAPQNIERLLYLAKQEILANVTGQIPDEEADNYNDYEKALLEQVKFFDENSDLLDSLGQGFSLGKYREGESSVMLNGNRLSPMTYKILLNMGLLYSGVDLC